MPDQAVVHDTQFLDAVWTGERFAATGWGGLFESPDGLSWRADDANRARYGPEAIAAGPRGLVAVGGTSSWFSPDGLTWTRSANAFPQRLNDADMVLVNDVVAMAGGWLAVGSDEPECMASCGEAPIQGLIWISTDGLSWERVTGQRSLRPGGINAVARLGDGFLAAGKAAGRAAFWTSSDGRTWARVPDSTSFGGPALPERSTLVEVSGVASVDGTSVAVGNVFNAGPSGEGLVVAWWSPDGTVWHEATVERPIGAQLFSVAWTSGRFLAVGPSGDENCAGGIWTSADGRAWTCEASGDVFRGFGPYVAVASPEVELALGLTDAGWDEASGEGLPGAVFWRPLR